MKYTLIVLIFTSFTINSYSQKLLNGIIIEDDETGKPIDEVRVDLINSGQSKLSKLLTGMFEIDISDVKQDYLKLRVYKPGWKVSYPISDKNIITLPKNKLKKHPLTIKMIREDSLTNNINEVNTNNEYYFALQLFSSKSKNIDDNNILKIEKRLGFPIKEIYQDYYYKYICGEFTSINEVEYYRSQVKNINYEAVTNAVIVKVYRNPLTPYYRIQIKAGNKLESKKKLASFNQKLLKLEDKIIIEKQEKDNKIKYKYLLSSKYIDVETAFKKAYDVRKLGFKGAYPVRYRLKEMRTE